MRLTIRGKCGLKCIYSWLLQWILQCNIKLKSIIMVSYTSQFLVISVSQQTLSMGLINISLRTLTISCDNLWCRVITIHLHWPHSDIKQIYPVRFVSIGYKLAMLKFIVNCRNLKRSAGNRKWSIYSKPNLYWTNENMFTGIIS